MTGLILPDGEIWHPDLSAQPRLVPLTAEKVVGEALAQRYMLAALLEMGFVSFSADTLIEAGNIHASATPVEVLISVDDDHDGDQTFTVSLPEKTEVES